MSDTKPTLLFSAVIQLMGKPQDHVEKTMDLVMQKLKQDDRFSLQKQTLSSAEELEQNPGFYSMFADVEVQVPGLSHLYDFIFEYTPSSIQIIEPEEVVLPSIALSNALNDMSARMHENDMYAREQTQRMELLTNDYAIMIQNAIVLSLASAKRTKAGIAKAIGCEEKFLDKFLTVLSEKKRIVQTGDLYALP